MGVSVHSILFAALFCFLYKGDVVRGDCSMTNIPTHRINYTLSNELKDGSMLRFQCPKGLYPYPDLTLRCQLNNRWDPEPRRNQRCTDVECPDPTVLQNGYITPISESRRYFYKSQITYTCTTGYTLFGPSQRTCLESGKWSGPNPVCRRDSDGCPDPGIPPGGTRTGNIFEIGDKVTFGCKSNMILIGSEERECQVNNRWSGTETACYYPHTYDEPWEVSEVFGGEIKNTLASHALEDKSQGYFIQLTRNGTLNMFIAVDVSESIDEEDFKNAKEAVITLIKKIETFSVYPNYEVIFFSSIIHSVVNILDFYGDTQPKTLKSLLDKFSNYKINREDKVGTNLNAVFKSFYEKMGVIKTQQPTFYEHQHVIILFTDGGYNTGGAPTQNVELIKALVYNGQPEAREKHLDIYVFGIGTPIYDDVLKPLQVGIGEKHYFRLKDLSELHETFDSIIDEADVMTRCGLHQDYGDLYDATEKRKNFPWVVYISSMAKGKTRSCLGSLVSLRFVLTAAHCFKGNSSVTVEWSEGKTLVVKEIHIHPRYDISARQKQGVMEFYDYDVALIELQSDAPKLKTLRPICIPCTAETNMALRHTYTCKEQEDFLIKNLERVTFLTKKDLKEKEARLKLESDKHDCIIKALQAPNITTSDVTHAVTENFLCTGGQSPYLDKVSCTGDSGGAVFKNYEGRTIQLAVVSWGTKQMPECGSDEDVNSDAISRDFHINLFKVVPFLKSILGKQMQSFAPLEFVD